MVHIGISIQGGLKTTPITDISAELHALHEEYYQLRNQHLNAETLEDFMILRQIMHRISAISEETQKIYLLKSQDIKLAKSLSTGLDLEKFVQKEEKLNSKVFLEIIRKIGQTYHSVFSADFIVLNRNVFLLKNLNDII